MAALAGAGGGLLSFPVGELVGLFTDTRAPAGDLLQLILGSALWSGSIGLLVGAAILVFDNLRSLRGQWHRDLLGGLPLFFALSFVGGAAGQFAYSFVQNSLTRGIGWALMGAGVGVGVGLLRRDPTQAGRGALGGALGGFVGGFIFDALTLVSSAGGGSLSRFVGQILMGALIALLMRVVQDALKNAWLLGISSGVYEGKEYPLNTSRVSIGRADSNDIALFRENELPAQIGAFVFQNEQWWWQGAPVSINGVPQAHAPLAPGDQLQFGSTRFRFGTRSQRTPGPQSTFAAPPPDVSPAVPPPTQMMAPSVSPLPPIAPLVTPAFALMAISGQLVRLPALSAPVSVGRTQGNGLVLADPSVSATHARFQLIAGVLTVIDLGSTNGTFVNGEKLPPHAARSLQIGDRVRFGRLEYSVRTT